MRFVSLLLVISLVIFSGSVHADLKACQDQLAEWKKLYNSLATEGCFNSSVAPDQVKGTINCTAQFCVTEFTKLLDNYQEIFVNSMCKTYANFSAPKNEEKMVMALQKGLVACNKCLSTYAMYEKVQQEWETSGCQARVGTAAICQLADCVDLSRELYDLWTAMIPGGMCHPYMPGACNDLLPETEGQVYDTLYAQSTSVLLYKTIPNLCSSNCGSYLLDWYEQWVVFFESPKHCAVISSPSTDPYFYAQTFVSVTVDCTHEQCAERMDALIKEYYKIPLSCTHGISSEHKNVLTNALNPRNCKSSQEVDSHGQNSWIFQWGPVVGYLIIMCLISLGVFVMYFIVELCYNRIVRKRRGLDQIPNVFFWRNVFNVPVKSSATMSHKIELDRDETVRLNNDSFALNNDFEEDENL